MTSDIRVLIETTEPADPDPIISRLGVGGAPARGFSHDAHAEASKLVGDLTLMRGCMTDISTASTRPPCY